MADNLYDSNLRLFTSLVRSKTGIHVDDQADLSFIDLPESRPLTYLDMAEALDSWSEAQLDDGMPEDILFPLLSWIADVYDMEPSISSMTFSVGRLPSGASPKHLTH